MTIDMPYFLLRIYFKAFKIRRLEWKVVKLYLKLEKKFINYTDDIINSHSITRHRDYALINPHVS